MQICEGVSLNGPCRISADCNVGLFCNFWHCTRLLRPGEKCTSHDQCGRDALCYISNIGNVAGICTNLFTYDDDYQLLPLGLDDKPGKLVDAVYFFGAEKLCRSGWVESDGKCGSGLISKNKVFSNIGKRVLERH